jgi:hypothetical protein
MNPDNNHELKVRKNGLSGDKTDACLKPYTHSGLFTFILHRTINSSTQFLCIKEGRRKSLLEESKLKAQRNAQQ